MADLEDIVEKPMLFVQFSIFAHRLPREQFSGMHVQNEPNDVQNDSGMTPNSRSGIDVEVGGG